MIFTETELCGAFIIDLERRKILEDSSQESFARRSSRPTD